MNLKYYLRGLGLGIVITAVLLGITSGGRKETLTDEEIITRAKTLGMIEDSELSGYMEKAKSDAEAGLRMEIERELQSSLREQIRAESETDPVSQPQIPEGAGDASNQAADSSEETKDMSEEAEQEPLPEPVEFTVYRGELPKDISSRLEKAGLVESASEFEKFLLGNGYDRAIVASRYFIPVDADEEQIARIITGNRGEGE